jgi:hypothetical protein
MLARSLPLWLSVLCLSLLLIGCQDHQRPATGFAAPTAAASPIVRENYDPVPKLYDVPAGREAEVRRLLRGMSYPVSVITHDGAQTQFVPLQATFTSDQHLIINAPPQYHPAIDEILKKLATSPVTPQSFEVTYWIVRADAAKATTIAPDLAEIAGVLEQLPGLGTRAFAMLDHLSARTSDGDEAKLGGQVATIQQRLTSMPGIVDLELDMTVRAPGATAPAQIETQLRIKPDAPVVLGDSAATQTNLDAPAALLLYIVRVRATP